MTTEAMADYLQFEGGAVGAIHRVGWRGPWPPPETMIVARGHATGEMVVTDEASLEPGQLDGLVNAPTISVTRYRRDSYSELPPQPADGHVARGARYVVQQDLAVVIEVHQ